MIKAGMGDNLLRECLDAFEASLTSAFPDIRHLPDGLLVKVNCIWRSVRQIFDIGSGDVRDDQEMCLHPSQLLPQHARVSSLERES